ncbi:MAG: hydrogenase maturation nickel metallochaperone HypA [Anaerolineales bacterium]|nr:hydrogenase maturation nickel metallochaperone HypA [Anaerolineales bacterium]
MLNQKLNSIFQKLKKSPQESIRFVIGELIYDEKEFHQQWKQLIHQTALQETKLNIRIIPAEQQCMVCFEKYHPQSKETTCPHCGSVGAKILAGEEFYLESIEE